MQVESNYKSGWGKTHPFNAKNIKTPAVSGKEDMELRGYSNYEVSKYKQPLGA